MHLNINSKYTTTSRLDAVVIDSYWGFLPSWASFPIQLKPLSTYHPGLVLWAENRPHIQTHSLTLSPFSSLCLHSSLLLLLYSCLSDSHHLTGRVTHQCGWKNVCVYRLQSEHALSLCAGVTTWPFRWCCNYKFFHFLSVAAIQCIGSCPLPACWNLDMIGKSCLITKTESEYWH